MRDLWWELSLGMLGGLLLWTYTSQVDKNLMLEIDRSQMNRVTELYGKVANSVNGAASPDQGKSIDGLTKTIEALRVAVDKGRVSGTEAQGLSMKVVSMSARRLSDWKFHIEHATHNNGGGVLHTLATIDKTKIAEGDMSELQKLDGNTFPLLGDGTWVAPKTEEEADKMEEALKEKLVAVIPPRDQATIDVLAPPSTTGDGFIQTLINYDPQTDGVKYVLDVNVPKRKRRQGVSSEDPVALPPIPLTTHKGQRGKSMGRITLVTQVGDPKVVLRVPRTGRYSSPLDEGAEPLVLTASGSVVHPRFKGEAKLYYWDVDLETHFHEVPQVAFVKGALHNEFYQADSMGSAMFTLDRYHFKEHGDFPKMANFMTAHEEIFEAGK